MNFANALGIVLRHEGGLVEHRDDPGGVTHFGISQRAYPDLDIRNLLLADAARIYERDYWQACRCDDLPYPVALAVFDTAVNCGVARSVRFLQAAVGAKKDGVIGPVTLAAVKSGRARDIAQAVLRRRMVYYTGLESFVTFGIGWSARVIDVAWECGAAA